jgi:hypothetical protein
MTPRQALELREAHPLLVSVLEDVWRYWPSPAIDFVVTSIGRTPAEDAELGASGIHAAGPPWRALDFRVVGFGANYGLIADELANSINTLWAYDLARPTMTVLFVAPHGNGPHGHLQVHPSTRHR